LFDRFIHHVVDDDNDDDLTSEIERERESQRKKEKTISTGTSNDGLMTIEPVLSYSRLNYYH